MTPLDKESGALERRIPENHSGNVEGRGADHGFRIRLLHARASWPVVAPDAAV